MTDKTGYQKYRPEKDKVLYFGPITPAYKHIEFRELMENKFGAEEVGRSKLANRLDWTYRVKGVEFRLEHLLDKDKALLILFKSDNYAFDEVKDMIETEMFRNKDLHNPNARPLPLDFTEGVKIMGVD